MFFFSEQKEYIDTPLSHAQNCQSGYSGCDQMNLRILEPLTQGIGVGRSPQGELLGEAEYLCLILLSLERFYTIRNCCQPSRNGAHRCSVSSEAAGASPPDSSC